MLKFIILSDAQSELMQGGNGHEGHEGGWGSCKRRKFKRCFISNGHPGSQGYTRTTTKNISVSAGQTANSTSLVFGGHNSSAVSDVIQTMTIGVTA